MSSMTKEQQEALRRKQIETLRKIPTEEKQLKVAPYFPCGEANCACKSFKDAYTEARQRAHQQGLSSVEKPPLDQRIHCLGCSHPVQSHGFLAKIAPNELDRRFLIVYNIEKLSLELRKPQNETQKDVIMRNIHKLREELRKSMMSVSPTSLAHKLGTPPFEPPEIIRILKNFLELKYVGQVSQSQFNDIHKLCKTFITAINRQELPSPTRYAKYNPNDRTFAHNYHRWRLYCRGVTYGSVAGQRYDPCRVFGRSFLLSVFTLAREQVNTAFLPPPEMKPLIPQFFEALKNEIVNPKSPIFDVNFQSRAEASRKRSAPSGPRDGWTASPNKRTKFALHTVTTDAAGRVVGPAPPGAHPQRAAGQGSVPPDVSLFGRRTIAPSAVQASGFVAPKPVSAAQSKSAMSLALTFGDAATRAMTTATGSSATAASAGMVGSAAAAAASTSGPGGVKPMEISAGDSDINTKTDESGVPAPTRDEPRDERAKREEETGIVRFESVYNDGKAQSLIWLSQVKGVVSRGLPKMPKSYITRLVFDHKHRALCLIKRNRVIGAIVYRPFVTQGFAEVVFLAIDTSEQIKGYGTHLMNHLKEVVKTDGIYNFLTYADNFAVGYFRKQGFSDKLTLPRKRWYKYIKDYVGANLMECRFNPEVDYLRVPIMVQNARKVLESAVSTRCNNHVVYPGLDLSPNGNSINVADIPGLADTQWAPHDTPSQAEIDELHVKLRDVVNQVKAHRKAEPFLHPVPAELTEYHKLVKSPMDISTIEARVESGAYYKTKALFTAEFSLIFTNARFWNDVDTDIYKFANALEHYFKSRMLSVGLG